jgi:glycerophosphoryl diester phosphodiesterase
MPVVKTYFSIAYGGATASCPPGHTIASIKKAIDIGAAMIFVDARVTRDNELVVWPSMQRLENEAPLHLKDFTLAQWRQKTKDDPAQIASLEEVLELIVATRTSLAIELRAPGMENALARLLRRFKVPYERLLLTCSTENSRLVFRSLDPNIPLAHRFTSDAVANVGMDTLGQITQCDAVLWPAKLMTQSLVQGLKKKGVIVYAGPVNLMAEMRRLRDECGVDGILTPYIDLLVGLNQSKAA